MGGSYFLVCIFFFFGGGRGVFGFFFKGIGNDTRVWDACKNVRIYNFNFKTHLDEISEK